MAFGTSLVSAGSGSMPRVLGVVRGGEHVECWLIHILQRVLAFTVQDFCNFIPDNSQLEYTQECKVGAEILSASDRGCVGCVWGAGAGLAVLGSLDGKACLCSWQMRLEG